MGKLSIPTWKYLKQLPAISLLATTPLLSSAQQVMQDTAVSIHLDLFGAPRTEEDLIAQKSLDSSFQVLKPYFKEFYEPHKHYNGRTEIKCRATQKAIKNVLVIRTVIPYEGLCLKGMIVINKHIDDPQTLSQVLQHEIFHLEDWEETPRNLGVYRKLPLDEIKAAYFPKLLWMQVGKFKNNLSEIYDVCVKYEDIEPGCDPEAQEKKDDFIRKAYQELDTLSIENYVPSSEDSGILKELVKETNDYIDYITHQEEIYARARCIQNYLFFAYNIQKQDITAEQIYRLRYDPQYKDPDFLMLIDGHESDLVEYIKEIEPK